MKSISTSNISAAYSLMTLEVVRPNGVTVIGPEEIGASHEKSLARLKARSIC